jgi:two-component system heavy metal sensor histidine kinase CusS
VLILTGTSLYLLRVIEHHFVEQDLAELRGKLELASRLLDKTRAEDTLEFLPHHLDNALVGHQHLSLAVFENNQQVYAYGKVAYPDQLLSQAQTQLSATKLMNWMDEQSEHRGLALRITAADGQAAHVLAVAVDTAHHREFIDSFKLALWIVFAFATLLAAVLGWGVARVGLTPLRQTARLASEITAERIDTRLSGDRVPPELGDLALSFNAMLDRLRDSIDRLSSFAADLAHEMRTPVNNLMMQTQVMLSQSRSAEEYREVLASNLEEYERLARMIGDMLFLAKADNGLLVPSRENVDLANELDELFDFYEALADDKGVRMQCEGTAMVDGDRLMIRRALSNLISNAIRYTPRNTIVRVQLQEAEGQVQIAIKNPCTDIPENPERLFDRFYRADPARRETGEGAGLGLAITRSIIRAHGGEVTVKSSPTEIGFSVILPVLTNR